MGAKTGISWTDSTWNPIRGCSRVSTGCEHCYAEVVAGRFSGPGQPYEGLIALTKKTRWNGRTKFVSTALDLPLRWTKPRRIFTNSMSDLFHESLSNEQIAAVFGVMAAAPKHTFQVLTKRPERAAAWFKWVGSQGVAGVTCLSNALALGSSDSMRAIARLHALPRTSARETPTIQWPLPNVWLGVSVENQETAETRIPVLLELPAVVRFVSAEPLLGPLDLSRYLPGEHVSSSGIQVSNDSLDWVIVGGESGPKARPCALEWIGEVAHACSDSGVPGFVKQLGGFVVSEGRTGPPSCWAKGKAPALAPNGKHWAWRMGLKDRKGGDPTEWPDDLRIQQFPEVQP